MGILHSLKFHRRVQRQWAECINSLGQIVAGAELTLQRAFSNDASLIPIPIKVLDQRRHDQRLSHD